MNYLQLSNAALEKCGISGNPLTTVAGQSKERLRLINWINDAWMDIQGAYENWMFMRASFTFPTVNGQQSYTPAQANTTNFANWKILPENTFRIYQTSLGFSNEIWMPRWDYAYFRDLYLFGAMRTNTSRPVVYTIDDFKNIILGPIPNAAGYTVVGDYYKVPTELALDADIPSMPVEYHRAIVFRTMMFYGAYESAPDVYNEGKEEFKKIMMRLELNQLPQIDLGGPLV